jgi:hypothetical protein
VSVCFALCSCLFCPLLCSALQWLQLLVPCSSHSCCKGFLASLLKWPRMGLSFLLTSSLMAQITESGHSQ